MGLDHSQMTPQPDRTQEVYVLHETASLEIADDGLGKGWILLKVLTKRDEGEYASYVLGWPRVLGAPEFPEKPKRLGQ